MLGGNENFEGVWHHRGAISLMSCLKKVMQMANLLNLLNLFVPVLAYFCLRFCIAIDNITITQLLRDPESILSSGQTFKLGFFSPTNRSIRYVGIMYNVPVTTVVWVANRDKPLNDSGGTLTISEDGNLVILNGQKEIWWSSNVSNSVRNCTAQLLDTGNLVLKETSSGRIIWESFEIPSDSLLPRMRLSAAPGTKEKSTSWNSPYDPTIGNFSVGLQTLPTAQIFIWNKSKAYWRSGPWGGKAFIGIQDMESFYLNGYDLVDGGSASAYFTFTLSNDSTLGYYFYHLTSTGILDELYWEDGNENWEVSWSSMQSQCDIYGKCGPFGSCNAQDSTICTCLKGFDSRDKEEWDRGNWSGGCKRKTPLQCEKNDSAGEDSFVKLANMKVPDFAELKPVPEEQCGNLCLRNCSCMAYSYYTGIGCMHWSDSLIDIQQFPKEGADLYIRVAHSKLDNDRDMRAVIASTVVLGILFLVAASAYIFWKCLAMHKGKNRDDELSLFEAENQMENMPRDNLKQTTLEELPLYSYVTLASATDNFASANKLGRGGFGQVYKGKLENGQEIAVKRLSKSSVQGIEEFMNEVVVISKLQHRNLVRLLGCCVEREEKMLIYEYMPNRSLDAYLFDSFKQDLLGWNRRILIVEGIGRGLLYLHRDSRLKIIHRDLKPSNILLDEELNPKISDFGLARIFRGNQDQADTRRVVGTYGYMAPEYAMEGRFSEKSDVYSYGILLLEIVSGRRNTCFSQDENGLSLLRYAWKLWNEGEAVKLIDPSIFDPSIEMEILRYVHVGLLCVQEFPNDRPHVSSVLSMLNREISELPRPQLPAFTERLTSLESEYSQQSAYSVNNASLTIIEAR